MTRWNSFLIIGNGKHNIVHNTLKIHRGSILSILLLPLFKDKKYLPIKKEAAADSIYQSIRTQHGTSSTRLHCKCALILKTKMNYVNLYIMSWKKIGIGSFILIFDSSIIYLLLPQINILHEFAFCVQVYEFIFLSIFQSNPTFGWKIFSA